KGDKSAAPENAAQIEAGVLLQSTPGRDAFLYPLNKFCLLVVPTVILLGVELRKFDRVIDPAGLLLRFVICFVPFGSRAGKPCGAAFQQTYSFQYGCCPDI